MNNSIVFRLWGNFALFTDPITKIGGEKCSYHIPTYEALKGIVRSIYWKPTFIWYIDKIRIIKQIRTQTKGVKPLNYSEGGNTLAFYNYLSNVEYQIQAHFEWNMHLPELINDRIDGKHYEIAQKLLKRGGRRDIFLGTRECQGYVEPCGFFDTAGDYDNSGEQSFALMVHGIDYPDEYGDDKLRLRMWYPKMVNGVIDFPRPEDCTVRRVIRKSSVKTFSAGENFSPIDDLFLQEGGVPE